MSGAIHPLPNTPSWRGTELEKAEGQLYIYLCPPNITSGRSHYTKLRVYTPYLTRIGGVEV
jgi:hypothetical protein